MKTIRAALQARLDAGATTLAYCVRIVRTDSQEMYLTNHVEDIDIGGNVYLSAAGYTPTALSQNDTGRADTVDVEGILSSAGVSRADIAAGLYDNARIYAFITDYNDPVVDDIKQITGFWGKTKLERRRYVAEFVSLAERLSQQVGRTFKAACDADLGDTADASGRVRCGVRLLPDAWTLESPQKVYEANTAGDAKTGDLRRPTTQNGYFYLCTTAGTQDTTEPASWSTTVGGTTSDGSAVFTTIVAYTLDDAVDTVTSRSNFTATSLTQDADWWLGGLVTFTSGLNNGFSSEVKSSTTGGVIDLFTALPYDIAVSDTFTIQAGCQKRHTEDCIGKFDNKLNFQGFPHVPTQDEVLKFGGQ